MGCNCHTSRKQDKKVITELAIRYAKTMEVDVQIYTWTQRGLGRLYDFEIANSQDRGIGLVKIINFRDYTSKDVLQDSIEPEQNTSRKTGDDSGKRSRKDRKYNKKPKGHDEPVRGVNAGESESKVAGDSGAILQGD